MHHALYAGYLLKAGLSETIICVLAHWSPYQVRRYGNRLALNLGLGSVWPFYNQVSIAGAYVGSGVALAAP